MALGGCARTPALDTSCPQRGAAPSGRQLTLSCAYRRQGGEWRLLRARVDEGTHALQVSGRAEPPALIYRDAGGRLLEVVAVKPLTDGGRIP